MKGEELVSLGENSTSCDVRQAWALSVSPSLMPAPSLPIPSSLSLCRMRLVDQHPPSPTTMTHCASRGQYTSTTEPKPEKYSSSRFSGMAGACTHRRCPVPRAGGGSCSCCCKVPGLLPNADDARGAAAAAAEASTAPATPAAPPPPPPLDNGGAGTGRGDDVEESISTLKSSRITGVRAVDSLPKVVS